MMKSAIRWITATLEDLVRIAAMRGLLLPAARVLPRSSGLALADAVSWLLLILPRPGLGAYRDTINSFGRSPMESLLLARRWLARPLRDFVMLNRILRDREDPSAWTVREENAVAVDRLRATGTPFMVAVGHVSRESMVTMYLRTIAPGSLIHVGAPIPASVASLNERRTRIHYRASLDCVTKLYGPELQFVYVSPEHPSPALPIAKKLRKPGSTVYIHIDAPWSWRGAERGSFERPFAGSRLRVFSLGAARLARLAKCPIVLCLPRIAGDGTMVLEWGEPLTVLDEASDIPVMNSLLDRLETAVGTHPDQYLLPFGRDRRWNATLQR
ncbi:MAG: hypothetical protein IH602_04770, partial [Bryobacteraceae bacterium]|nr:hypothetical protein [Bryobacteraceae bacterium]